MEKFFKITNDRLANDVDWYRKSLDVRSEFIRRFFSENGINGDEYYLGGSGFCNCEFQEIHKDEIRLAISATENNMSKFKGDFKKDPVCGNLLSFKKTSKLLKKFQDECIQNHIIINLLRIRIGDYFKELRLGGYDTAGLHLYEGAYYLRISTDRYDSITPERDGFEEIKGSEYYTVVEKLPA